MFTVEEALAHCGGLATRRQLEHLVPRRALRAAVEAGTLVPAGRGRFAEPEGDQALTAALRLGGVVSHRSAALGWGWPVLEVPDRPEVIVPRRRALPAARRAGVAVRWADLAPDDVRERRTNRLRTVVDCARVLPFAAALAVADSALREGVVTPASLRLEASASPRTGRPAAIRVARHADARAANPFESALRAVCLDVEGLEVVPQFQVDRIGRADLGDPALGLVIEAESREFHATAPGFHRDVRRYTAMVAAGWTVLRFTWPEVMDEPAWIRQCLAALVERGPDPRAVGRRRPRRAA